MTEQKKFKAGDRVTLVLSQSAVDGLNNETWLFVSRKDIISHEPEPVVGFVNVYDKNIGVWVYDNKRVADNAGSNDRIACLKITYNPATKEAKAEVV